MLFPKRRSPTLPGKILLEDFLKPLMMTPKKFASALGGDWTEKKVDDIIKGKQPISEEIAKAFAEVLDTKPKFWMRLQHYHTQFEEIHRQNEKGSLKAWKKAG